MMKQNIWLVIFGRWGSKKNWIVQHFPPQTWTCECHLRLGHVSGTTMDPCVSTCTPVLERECNFCHSDQSPPMYMYIYLSLYTCVYIYTHILVSPLFCYSKLSSRFKVSLRFLEGWHHSGLSTSFMYIYIYNIYHIYI